MHLPQVLARYHKQHPKVAIDLQTGASQELVQQVLNYDIEGALVGGLVANSEIIQQEICVEEMVLVTAPDQPAPDTGTFDTILVFRPGCSCRNRLEQWLREQGLTPIKLMEFGTLDAILGCVGAGMGITMLPRSFVERGPFAAMVRTHQVAEPFSRVPTMFIRRKDMTVSPALCALLELFQEERAATQNQD